MILNLSKGRISFKMKYDEGELIGRKIGEQVELTKEPLEGYVIEIRGGSDKDGTPMVPFVEGASKKRVLLKKGDIGINTKEKGFKKRKSVHGNTISDNIVQVNAKVIKEGKMKFEEVKEKYQEKTEKE